ncbi:alpha/beta hydrolase [Fulvivirgaceae bacterium PWU20]|uniref:Alpha/beta hydrolase n=2 Tax=Chryseosolibacter indicus TaxID=2782351 RepID=A0ABS5VUT8_9BACT|nr:alpha/beta hydrolase [Chryseosolibacter indicus]MBT1703756.1 alpha/beta hydrolase [Chryseosolibacter indicus]
MFAHGFGVSQSIWRFITPAFEEDYKIILFDYVGCGDSDASAYIKERYATLDGYVLDVLEICEALKLTNVIYVGHSISSMIGLLAAIKQPERFSKMVFIAPSPCYVNNEDGYVGGFKKKEMENFFESMERDYINWANEAAPTIMNNPDKPEFTEELIKSLVTTDRQLMRQFALATFFSDHRKDLLKFKKPALIMQCAFDIMAPLQVGDYLHAHLEKSDLKLLKAKGHFPQLTAPAETIREIKSYLG